MRTRACVIADAGPLIHLDELGVIDLLGVILRSMRRGLQTKAQVVATLRAVPSVSTLHIRPALLEEIVATAERHPEP